MYLLLILLLLQVQYSHQAAFIKAILFQHHQVDEDGARMDITSSMDDNIMFAGRLAWEGVRTSLEDDRVTAVLKSFKDTSMVDEADECCFKTRNTLRVFRRLAKQLIKSGEACVNRATARVNGVTGEQSSTLESLGPDGVAPELIAEFYRLFYPNFFSWSSASCILPFAFKKTRSMFPKINFSYEQAIACEVLLADLFSLMWSNVDGAAFESFDDFAGMLLLYVFTQPGCEYKELLNLLGKIVHNLPVPEAAEMDRELALGRRDLFISSLFLGACQTDLKVCFDSILNMNLLLEHSESTIKMVISTATLEIGKKFLARIDRNCRLGLQPLAHFIFHSERFDLLKVLMRFGDLEWNAVDFFGCTVLSYFINWEDDSLDQLYVTFVLRSKCSYYCGKNKCILEEALEAERRIGQRALKRLLFFLENRHKDGLEGVMVTAASLNRMDLFSQMLQLRLSAMHELDDVFQTIYHFLKLDEPAFEEYLQLIIDCVRSNAGKNHSLAQMFLFKWTSQLALWHSAQH